MGKSLVASEPPLLEAQLKAALNLIPAHTWYAAPSGALIFLNERGSDYLGLPQDHSLRFGIDTGAAWDSHFPLVHPDDHEETRRVWSTCLSRGSAGELSFRVRSAEGKYRWFLSRAEPLRANDGTLRYWIGVNLDIDDSKRAEDALRKSEKELRDAIDTIPAIVWSALPDGSNIYVNKRYVEYMGSSAEQTAGSGWQALIHPDDLERHASKWREAVATGKLHENEVRSRRSDGQYRWQLDRGVPLRDEDGNIVKWYGITTDIEDRKCAEEALQQSQFYLAEGQRLAHMGSWAFNATGFTYWSSELFQIHGLVPSGKPPTVEEYLDLVHPEDRGFMEQGIQKMLADHLGFDFTKRIVRPDGEIRHVRCVGVPATDGVTVLPAFVGTGMDVTELKRAEEELQQLVDFVPQLIEVLGPDGKCIHANRFAREYTGLTVEEYRSVDVIGEVIHQDDAERMRAERERALSGSDSFELELRLRGKDGIYRWFLALQPIGRRRRCQEVVRKRNRNRIA
jgi:PAS domain S-box-containing protein